VSQEIRTITTNSKLPAEPRGKLARRVLAFEQLLPRTRDALMRPGGGDEMVAATPVFAFCMLSAEARRLTATLTHGHDGTKRAARKK
jgi:hypothetical protein